MLKNNIEMDVKMRCIEAGTTQSKIAQNIGTSPSNVNKLIRNKEQVILSILVYIFFSRMFDLCCLQ